MAASTDYAILAFSNAGWSSGTDEIRFITAVSNNGQTVLKSTGVYRDTSAWMHVCLRVDTTQAVQERRVIIEINGKEVTLVNAGLSGTTWPALNASIPYMNTNAQSHRIGAVSSFTYDGYLAETVFVDGQSLGADNFGYRTPCGSWYPKQYAGTYGNNGFYLKYDTEVLNFASTIPGSYTYTAPPGVTSINVTLAAGGGGGGDVGSQEGGGGGGGGAYVSNRTYTVIPGRTYNIIIGGQGIAGWQDLNPGGSGGQSYIQDSVTLAYLVRLNGGTGGYSGYHYFYASSSSGEAGTGGTVLIDIGTGGISSAGGNGIAGQAFQNGSGGAGGQSLSPGGIGGIFGVIAPSAGLNGSGGGGGDGGGNHGGGIGGPGKATADAVGTLTLTGDASPNQNHWVAHNVSLASGPTYDWMLDSPTNNYAVLNSVHNFGAGSTINSGAMVANTDLTTQLTKPSTFQMASDQWYWEVLIGSGPEWYVGIIAENFSSELNLATQPKAACYYQTGNKIVNGVNTAYGAAFNVGDIIGIALDASTNIVTFFKNGVSQGQISVPNTSGTPWVAICSDANINASSNFTFNFGQYPFQSGAAYDGASKGFWKYAPPSGYKALCTKNLPTPAISHAIDHFTTQTYSGNGSTLTLARPGTDYQFGFPASFYDYPIANSLRFNGTNSQLTRPIVTSGNTQKWTFSAFAKITNFPGCVIFSADNGSGSGTDANTFLLWIKSSGNIVVDLHFTQLLVTTQTFVDPSRWQHIVLAVDTTNATANDRVKLYVDGDEITSFSTRNNPSLNQAFAINNALYNQRIGFNTDSGSHMDGYLAEVNFIDGQALNNSNFAEFNANGIWVPKAYTGTYGNNGFYLNFADGTNTTTLGNDASVNSNNCTLTGMTRAIGSTDCWTIDTPTNNFCTINQPIGLATNGSVSNGGLELNQQFSGSLNTQAIGTTKVSSGKWFWELTLTQATVPNNYEYFGVNYSATGVFTGYEPPSTILAVRRQNGNKLQSSGIEQPYGSPGLVGDVYGFALNIDDSTFTVYKNGVSMGVLASSLPIGEYTPFVWLENGNTTSGHVNMNFGSAPLLTGATFYPNANGYFKYAPPAGYKSLSSANFPIPTAQNWNPGLMWFKQRSTTGNHTLIDPLRTSAYLSTNTTNAEAQAADMLLGYTPYEIDLGSNALINTNGTSYVNWTWRAANLGVADTSGTIASVVSANRLAGFSIVTYTGTGMNDTVGHGLNVTPSMIIVKNRDSGAAGWPVFHKNMDTSAPAVYGMLLNDTAARTSQPTYWNSVAPTSSVFSVGTNALTNGSASKLVAYCFTDVPGYSKFGSYTGNGSADGPFVYCGFRPRFVMVKSTSSLDYWVVQDSVRSPSNAASYRIFPSLSDAEGIGSYVDFVSNGFKFRQGLVNGNETSSTYLFAAFAEVPFKYANAR